MATTFVPPKLSDYQGPDTSFTPPPLSAHEGPDPWHPAPVSIPLRNGAGRVLTDQGAYLEETPAEQAAMAPLRFIADSATQAGQGYSQMRHPQSLDDFLGGVNTAARGTGSMMLPFAAPSMLSHPIATLLGLGVGSTLGAGTEAGAGYLGAGPGTAALLGTGVGGVTGGLTGTAVASAPRLFGGKSAATFINQIRNNPKALDAFIELLPKGRQINRLRRVLAPPTSTPSAAPAQPRAVRPPPITWPDAGTYGSTEPAPEAQVRRTAPPPMSTPAPGTYGSTQKAPTLPARMTPPPPLRGSSLPPEPEPVRPTPPPPIQGSNTGPTPPPARKPTAPPPLRWNPKEAAGEEAAPAAPMQRPFNPSAADIEAQAAKFGGQAGAARATPPAGGPPKYPLQYSEMADKWGHEGAQQAYEKDLRIAKSLHGQNITPEQWEQMSLDDQNKQVVKVPNASGGRHQPMKAEATSGRRQRPAAETVSSISQLLRGLYGK